MRITKQLFAVTALVAATVAAPAHADQPPPLNPIFNLSGQAIPHTYTSYSFGFVAGTALTNLTFAFREDPAYWSFDNVVMTLTGSSTNLLVNGDFELGVVGQQAPVGWTYVNQYGASAAGVVRAGCGVGGGNCYYDGAVGAYDAITQAVATVIGQSYTVSFMLTDNSNQTTASAVTNGNLAGINVTAYAQAGIPQAGTVPEPATWAMMLVGFGAMGFAMRRRQKVRVSYAA